MIMNEFTILDAMIEALGASASDDQQMNLVDWIAYNIGQDYLGGVFDVLCANKFNLAARLLSERIGELGLY
tara:strand:- start:276 stop:488 length:213 start_codon:yes stop_codon:yes gene_type:complete